MTDASPAISPAPERALMPDLLRAFALVGIAIVNVCGFAAPMETGFSLDADSGPVDRAAYLMMAGLFLSKSYPLFSMMFGAGLAYQILSAERAGKAFAPRYFRRMGALMFLGILHFVFFWLGDILMTYAILGAILYAIRNASVKTLVRTGIILIALNALMLAAFAGLIQLATQLAPEAMPTPEYFEQMTAPAYAAFGDGNFWQAALYRLGQLPMILPSVLFQQGLGVFGFFCFGLAAVKAGVIDKPDAHIWKRSRMFLLPIGLAGSFFGASVLLGAESAIDPAMLGGMAILTGFSAFSALGYAGVIALFSKGRGGAVRRFLAKAGSASLTAYLMQSLILSLVFTNYGLDLYGKLPAAQVIGIGLAAGLASLVFTGVWRQFADRGPMEVLLRRFTYMGKS